MNLNVSDIDVGGLEPVEMGINRSIYCLSGVPDLILKVPHYEMQSRRERPFKHALRKIAPRGQYRVLTKEAGFQMRPALKYPDAVEEVPIPQFRGFKPTAQGLGALWELIGDTQGHMGRTLREIRASGMREEVLEPLNACCDALFRFGIVAPDLHAGNLVLQQKRHEMRFYLVDGFGDRNVIPLRSLSTSANIRSLNKNLAGIGVEIGADWIVGERRFVLN